MLRSGSYISKQSGTGLELTTGLGKWVTRRSSGLLVDYSKLLARHVRGPGAARDNASLLDHNRISQSVTESLARRVTEPHDKHGRIQVAINFTRVKFWIRISYKPWQKLVHEPFWRRRNSSMHPPPNFSSIPCAFPHFSPPGRSGQRNSLSVSSSCRWSRFRRNEASVRS